MVLFNPIIIKHATRCLSHQESVQVDSFWVVFMQQVHKILMIPQQTLANRCDSETVLA